MGQTTKMKTPTELTKEFIVDYNKCNDFAFSFNGNENADNKFKVEKMYDDLILKFCSPDKKYQGLSYGSTSSHCPSQELVIKEIVNATEAIVSTKFTNEKFNFIEHDYEYHFTLTNHRWVLEELYLVDDDGKYKSL